MQAAASAQRPVGAPEKGSARGAALLAAALSWIAVAVSAGTDLSGFGHGVAPHPANLPVLALDFDGDGRSDTLHVVTVARGARLAPEVRLGNPWRGRALPEHGTPLALAIAHAAGSRHLLHDAEFFATPIWRAGPPPLQVLKRNSPRHRRLARLARAARGDLLLLGTEAGIDIVLYWNGREYRLAWPDETP